MIVSNGARIIKDNESLVYPINYDSGCKIIDLVMKYTPDDLPVAKTQEIGHGADSRAIMIGEEIHLCGEKR